MAETWKKLAFEEDVVLKALFDAQTVLAATGDNTPVALTVAEQTLVGRLTGGDVGAIAMGISDNNIVQIDGADIANAEYAKFTAAGLESKTFAEVLADLSGQAGAGFDFNSQVVTVEDLIIADGGNIGSASDPDAIAIASGGEVTLSQQLLLLDVLNAGEDVDKFLVLDAGNNVDFRTGAEVLSDIGGSAGIDTSGSPEDDDFAVFTDADTIEGLSTAEAMAALSGGAAAAFDFNGQQLLNILLQNLADDSAKTALTAVLGMIVWQVDDACVYVCTEGE
jgi:hypothetical protein